MRAQITIPDNLCYVLRLRTGINEHRFPIKDYPKTGLEFLALVNDTLKANGLGLRNAEYSEPKYWGFVPANVRGVINYI